MIALVVCASAADARADWLFTPFIGGTFGMQTTFVDLELSEGAKQVIFGGSGAWLARDRILGGEIDFSYAPRFFETDNRGGLVVSSNAAAFMINVIAAVPLSVTRESLRPYVVGGAGMLHAAIDDPRHVATVHDNFAGMTLGGGVIGMVAADTGVRFDLRQLRSLSRSVDPVTNTRGDRLRFWRATVGVTLRY